MGVTLLKVFVLLNLVVFYGAYVSCVDFKNRRLMHTCTCLFFELLHVKPKRNIERENKLIIKKQLKVTVRR